MSVELAGLTLANPVLVASGCGGTGRELAAYGALADLGGFVTRSITLNPRPGGPLPRIVETPVRAGPRGRAAEPRPRAVPRHRAALAGPAGRPRRRLDRRRLAGGVRRARPPARPRARRRGDRGQPLLAGRARDGASSTCASRSTPPAWSRAVHRDLPRGLPVLAKLRTDVVRVVESARTVLDAGAAAVVVGNALPAAMPDGRQAGLSGPAIRPLALRCVAEVHAGLPDAQIVGGGWHRRRRRRAHASSPPAPTAVQIGTALLHDPTTAARIVADLASPTPTPTEREPHDLRRPTPRRDRRARPALRRHRPARRAAARVGPRRRRGRPRAVRAHRGRGARARTSRWSSRSRRSTSASAAAASRCSSGWSPSPAPPARWCCSTSSAATSAPPRRRTPTPTSTRPRRWPPTRSRRAPTSASARSTRSSTPPAGTAPGVFVLALTSNKEGPEVQHAPPRAAAPSPGPCSTTCAALNDGRRAAGLLRRGRRRHDRRHRRATSTSTARCSPPGTAPRAAPSTTCAGSSARPRGAVLPELVARPAAPPDPTPRALARRRPARQRRAAGLAGEGLARDRGACRACWRCCRCSGPARDPQEDYCAAVEEHQEELTRDRRGRAARTRCCGPWTIFRDLEAKAPGDITDEWQQVVGRIEALDEALRDADVDPATYDREAARPPDLGDERQAADRRGRPRARQRATTLDALQRPRPAGPRRVPHPAQPLSDGRAAATAARPIAAARAI